MPKILNDERETGRNYLVKRDLLAARMVNITLQNQGMHIAQLHDILLRKSLGDQLLLDFDNFTMRNFVQH